MAQQPNLKQQKRREIVRDLRHNQTLIDLCERVAYLLAEPGTLSDPHADIATRILSEELYKDVTDERVANKVCLNLKCARPASFKEFSLMKKDKAQHCSPKCQEEAKLQQQLAATNGSTLIENQVLLDGAAEVLEEYAQVLSSENVVEKMEKQKIDKLLRDFGKIAKI